MLRFRISLVSLAAGAALTVAQPAAAQMINGPEDCIGAPVDRQSFATALQVVQAILPPSEADTMMKQMINAIVPQFQAGFGPELDDPGLQAILDKRMATISTVLMPVISKHIPSMSNAMACAYVREFSPAELAELLTFSKTPTGRHYLLKSTSMVGDPSVVAANQAYFADLKPAAEAFGEEVRQDVSEYRRKKKK